MQTRLAGESSISFSISSPLGGESVRRVPTARSLTPLPTRAPWIAFFSCGICLFSRSYSPKSFLNSLLTGAGCQITGNLVSLLRDASQSPSEKFAASLPSVFCQESRMMRKRNVS